MSSATLTKIRISSTAALYQCVVCGARVSAWVGTEPKHDDCTATKSQQRRIAMQLGNPFPTFSDEDPK